MKDSTSENTLDVLLIGLGLSEKQSLVYRILLEIGQGSAATIISKSGLKRGITYAVLYDLEKEGLVHSFTKDGKTYFQAENPQKLIDLVEFKKEQINALSTSFASIVPKLAAQYKQAVGKPIIRYLEGEEGLKRIFDDVYAPGKDELLGCVDISQPSRKMYDHITGNLIQRRLKNKIFTRAFDTDSPEARELQKMDKKQEREIFLVDGKKYPMPAEVDIYEDKVTLLSFAKNDFVGLIIEDNSFAETLKSIFRLAFDLARKEKSSKDKNKIIK